MKESVKGYFARNTVLLCFLVLFTIVSVIYDSMIHKSIASLTFVITGVMNYFKRDSGEDNKEFARLLLLGLVLGMAGDIGILIDLKLGALFFAIGHLLYYLSFTKLCKASSKDIIPTTICLTISIFIVQLITYGRTDLSMQAVSVLYALIIAIMVGKAISVCLTARNRLTILVLVGCITFLISDFMVLCSEFIEEYARVADNWCRFVYFPAQFILAQSIASYWNTSMNVNEQ